MLWTAGGRGTLDPKPPPRIRLPVGTHTRPFLGALPLTPYRARPPPHPWLPRYTSEGSLKARVGRGRCASCTLTDTHRWRLRGLHAGSGARLPRSSSELSAHTRAHSRPLIHTPALCSAGPPEEPGLHLPRHHPIPEPGFGHFRPPPPIPRLECDVWHCVVPEMVKRGFSPTGQLKEETRRHGADWRIVPHPVSRIDPQAHSLAQGSWSGEQLSVTRGLSATFPHT